MAEVVGAAVGTGRVHLVHVLAGDPAHGVDVVDAAVPEYATRDGHVRGRRRGGVERSRPDGVQPPQPLRLNLLPGGGEPDVEPSLEADLYLGGRFLDQVDDLPGAGDVGRHRLLAEDGDSRLGSGPDEGGMGVRGRGDDEAVDTVAEQVVAAPSPARSHLRGKLSRPGRIGVDDYELAHLGQRMQRPGVQGSDAADPDDPDPHDEFSGDNRRVTTWNGLSSKHTRWPDPTSRSSRGRSNRSVSVARRTLKPAVAVVAALPPRDS